MKCIFGKHPQLNRGLVYAGTRFFFVFLVACKTGNMEHVISMAQNNQTITAQKGDIIHLQLEENPTTGYAWDIAQLDSNMLQLQSSDYKMNGNGAIGGGGMRDMVFIVSDTGTGRIHLQNKQRWSDDVYQQFDVNINVR